MPCPSPSHPVPNHEFHLHLKLATRFPRSGLFPLPPQSSSPPSPSAANTEQASPMDAAPRRTPIFVLSGLVDLGDLTDEPGHEWTKIECASKKAYGCGEHGQEAVEGLTLYVRLGKAPLLTSSLAIRMSDEALRRFDSELELGCPSEKDMFCLEEMRAWSTVQMAEEQDFTVIVLAFDREFHREHAYYLVYDHIGASLSMIKYIPDPYVAASTLKPVLKRYGSDFDLFLMARADQSSPAPQSVLCVCTPETRANPASDSPWQIRRLCFQHEEIQESFSLDVAFALQGKGFWADLSQGLIYCDLHTITSDVVDLGFIGLPLECRLDLEQTMEEMDINGMIIDEPITLTRTVGCVRDTIWFVCIDGPNHYANDSVKMWTLKVPGGKLHKGWWEKVEEVSVRKLWGLDSFKMAGLPEGPLGYPALTADGALSVVLVDQSKFHWRGEGLAVDDICIFDFDNCGQRLLWHGVVHDYPLTDPVIIPSNFLQRKHGSLKRKADENCPAAGLAALAGSKQRVD